MWSGSEIVANATILPIILEFKGCTSDANIGVILNTPGVTWSMGDASDGSVGFSLNAMALGTNRAAPIESIEMGESELAIRTAKDASADSFVLNAHLRVVGGVQQVEGYCTLNDSAEIRIFIPNHQNFEWRRGHNAMLLPLLHDGYRTARIVLRGLKPNRKVRLELDAEPLSTAKLRWSLGTQLFTGAGFGLRTSDGSALNLASFVVEEKTVELLCDESFVSSSNREVMMELWVEYVASGESNRLDRLLLKMESSADVVAIAQIGNGCPQYVTSSFIPFPL